MPSSTPLEIVPFVYQEGEDKPRKYKLELDGENQILYVNRLSWTEAQEFWRALAHTIDFVDKLNAELGEDHEDWGQTAHRLFPKTLIEMDWQLFLQPDYSEQGDP